MARIASIKYTETDEGLNTNVNIIDDPDTKNIINLINDSSVNNCDQIFYVDF